MASTRLIVSLALLLTCSTASLPLLAGGSITNATLPSGKPGTVRLLANRVGSGKAMVVQNDTDVPIEAVLRLTRMGAVIMPASPGFYHRPNSVSDLVDFIVARLLDHLGLPQDLMPRWGEERAKAKQPD